ncbi:MAG: hypothetical protein INQ03_20645 [Candidatus Heimdallarchaeota archaeon]|nr:hypothetical protein [Candidatus Heimdallarchaeota archaeon]
MKAEYFGNDVYRTEYLKTVNIGTSLVQGEDGHTKKISYDDRVFFNFHPIVDRNNLIGVFLFSIAVRMFILFTAYADPTYIRERAGFNIDFINHVWFVDEVLQGNFFYHNYLDLQIFYSPVTPVILIILAYPFILLFNNIDLVSVIIISSSLLMGIKAIGNYLLLIEYKQNKKLAALLVIFNPFELGGVIPWGGLSLIITTTSITYSILLYRKIAKKQISARVGFSGIITLLLISSFAHRTGTVVHIAAILLMATFYLRYRKLNMLDLNLNYSKWKVSLAFALFMIPIIWYYYLRVHGSVFNVVDFSPKSLQLKGYYIVKTITEGFPLLVLTLTGVYLWYPKKPKPYKEIKLYTFEYGYLFMTIIFMMIPFTDPDINSRFLFVIDGLLLFFWAYVEYYMRQMKITKRRYVYTYWISTVILCISVFVISILYTINYIYQRIGIREL